MKAPSWYACPWCARTKLVAGVGSPLVRCVCGHSMGRLLFDAKTGVEYQPGSMRRRPTERT